MGQADSARASAIQRFREFLRFKTISTLGPAGSYKEVTSSPPLGFSQGTDTCVLLFYDVKHPQAATWIASFAERGRHIGFLELDHSF